MATLNSLFICYAVTHTLVNSEQTVGYSVFRLLDDNTGQFDLCPSKVAKRIIWLYRRVINEGGAVSARREFRAVKAVATGLEVTSSVSAKDYILPQVFG